MTSPALPTIEALSENLVSQIEIQTEQALPILPKSFTRVLAKVFAAAHTVLYKYLGFIFLQHFVRFATNDAVSINGRIVRPLTEWGRLVGVGDPLDATQAELVLSVPVLVQTGSIQPGAQLVYSPAGVVYTVTQGVLLNASTVSVRAIAASDQNGGNGAGAIGNRVVGDELQWANPLPNVAKKATVTGQLTQGADAEDIEVYRARVIKRFQRKPQGGARADYQLWGEEAAGIVNVYPYAGPPGYVDLYVEATEASSGSADGIPTTAQLNAVVATVEGSDSSGLAARRPVNAAVRAFGISRRAFTVVVSGLSAPNPGEAQDAIGEAVDEYLRSREPYLVGLATQQRQDTITLAGVSGIVDQTASAVGATVNSVQLLTSSTPIAIYILATGEKAKLGSITFA